MEELHVSRTYGNLSFHTEQNRRYWKIKAEPHVLMMGKRIFPSTSRMYGELRLDATDSNTLLIEWFIKMYPLQMTDVDRYWMQIITDNARAQKAETRRILQGDFSATDIETILPLRSYQQQAVAVLLNRHSLLCADDLGLGKTSVALGAIAAGLSPAIVVCQNHLQQQWVFEASKFLSGVQAHIVKKTKQYPLPTHNLLVITYSKLAAWAEYLNGYQLIAFDEFQELRRSDSNKYSAAEELCSKIPNRLGLTATPIYNYGDEMFALLNLLEKGFLGSQWEFYGEWCSAIGSGHWKVRDPEAFGSFIAESGIFLRRRRNEVGRELPPITKVVEEVEYNTDALFANEHHAFQLAQRVLNGTWTERGKAALELDSMLRLQTGIAKAPFVADFVRQLVDSGESVVLAGWHHEVYTVWQRLFLEASIPFRSYTGTESPTQKEAAKQAFLSGEAKVLILSLRSGAGLNGLQTISNIIVFGELDWSPQVHDQCIGRLNRDGQQSPVTSVYLYAAGGSDPVIAATLGIKTSQSEGIINPGAQTLAFDQQVETSRASALARSIIAQQKKSPSQKAA